VADWCGKCVRILSSVSFIKFSVFVYSLLIFLFAVSMLTHCTTGSQSVSYDVMMSDGRIDYTEISESACDVRTALGYVDCVTLVQYHVVY